MGNSINNIFTNMVDKDTIKKAIRNASKDKGDQYAIIKILKDEKGNINKLHTSLVNKEFTPSPYKEEIKKCRTKVRLIKKHPFYPDRVVEHCIALVMLPHWNKIIRDCTFASWKGRGILSKNKYYNINHRIKKYICGHKLKDPLYCLRFNIKKCYESIDNEILKLVVAKYCKDQDVNKVIFDFIDSCKGLPIGSYLSQLLINLYLTQLDNFILNECKATEYVRYMDDGAIFSEDKHFLHEIKHRIQNYLWYVLHLELNSKRQIFPIGKNRRGRALDLCGYCFYRNFTLVRKRTKKRIKASKNNPKSMASYKGILMGCESKNLINSLGYDNIQELGH